MIISTARTIIILSEICYIDAILYIRSQDLNLKFFSKNLFACLQVETSSFCRLRVAMFGLQIIKYFSHRHKLHFLDTLL